MKLLYWLHIVFGQDIITNNKIGCYKLRQALANRLKPPPFDIRLTCFGEDLVGVARNNNLRPVDEPKIQGREQF